MNAAQLIVCQVESAPCHLVRSKISHHQMSLFSGIYDGRNCLAMIHNILWTQHLMACMDNPL